MAIEPANLGIRLAGQHVEPDVGKLHLPRLIVEVRGQRDGITAATFVRVARTRAFRGFGKFMSMGFLLGWRSCSSTTIRSGRGPA